MKTELLTDSFNNSLSDHVDSFSELDLHLKQLVELSEICHRAVDRGSKIVFVATATVRITGMGSVCRSI